MFIMLMVVVYIAYTSLSQPKNKAVAQGMKKFKPVLTRKTGMITVIKQTMQPGSVSALNSNIETIIPEETRYYPSSASTPVQTPTPPASAPTSPAPASAPTPPAPTPSASTPPTASGPAPASTPTPPASASTPPASASTPPASASTPPASAPTPPASAPTPPASASTPPASVSTPPAPAPAPASTPPSVSETSLYEFTTHTFTNAGALGRIGPSLSDIQIEYYKEEIPWVRNYIKMVGNDGIQIWTVPKTGNYLIQAIGASGNIIQNISGFNLCCGIHVQTTVTLKRGDIIKILVGQMGLGTGGGGGTFVTTNDNEAIIVAGGGGGFNFRKDHLSQVMIEWFGNSNANNKSNGLKTKKPTSLNTVELEYIGGDVDIDGNLGNGGGASIFAGGGGGFIKDGGDSTNSNGGKGGKSFLEGGRGGISSDINAIITYDNLIIGNSFPNCEGGFGGGGGGNRLLNGGGGGGYSGGEGGGILKPKNIVAWKLPWVGGGGGSYSNTPMTVKGYSTGHGKVVITFQAP